MKITFLTLASAVLVLGSASAQINGTFDSGLSGWTTRGDAAHRMSGGNGHAALTTAHTVFDDDAPLAAGALNLSGIDPVDAFGNLDLFSGLALGGLDIDDLNQATEGSAMQITFMAGLGDRLTFDWRFLTNDTGADYAFVSINGTLVTFGGPAGATLPGADGFTAQSPLMAFSHTFDTAGPVTLTIGIVDVGDYAASSMLTLDNVALTAVPEPGAYGIGIGALLIALTIARRRRAS